MRVLGGSAGVAGGFGIALFTVALGHCSAFGGRCPADPQPLLQDDVFGGVAVGLFVGLLSAALALWPDRTGVVVGIGAGAPLALVAGLAAARWAAG